MSDIQDRIAEVLAGQMFRGEALESHEAGQFAAMLAPLVREAQREAWDESRQALFDFGYRSSRGANISVPKNPYAEEREQDE